MELFRQPPESSTRQLLIDCGLFDADLEAHHFSNFLACGTSSELKGVIGVEIFDSVGLLRSLAVADAARGLGYAKALVQAIETFSKEQGVSHLYLLTTTAENFFSGVGYIRQLRDTAPTAIKNTQEFSTMCPSDAVLMSKKLIG